MTSDIAENQADGLKSHFMEVRNLCITLVTVNRKQRLGILAYLEKKQLIIIREMCVNLLLNQKVILGSQERAYFNNNLRKIKILGSKSSSFESKMMIIKQGQLLIRKIAKASLKYLDKYTQ